MVDREKLIENGKQFGIEYHFYDDKTINPCSCGGRARMYSKENTKKKFSFEHLYIRCEKCNKSASGDYDISGNPSKTYKTKDEVTENLINEWNGKNEKSVSEGCKNNGNGMFDRANINGNYNWNMPGTKK